MMKDGKLMWSRKSNGGWYTFAFDDEYRFYTAERDNGGWSAYVGVRFSKEKPRWLGWFIYLKDAKQEVDKHHHKHIRESDRDDLKAYIERYPVG
jgi:hypothetical protein